MRIKIIHDAGDFLHHYFHIATLYTTQYVPRIGETTLDRLYILNLSQLAPRLYFPLKYEIPRPHANVGQRHSDSGVECPVDIRFNNGSLHKFK